jgi:hypothetical protein
MNNLKVILDSLQGKSFEFLKKNCEFTIKENDDLYMLSFNRKNDLNDDIVRCVNGIILEKETNKLVHYAFSKAYEGLNEEEGEEPYLGELGNFRAELIIEGTLIKVFYHNEKWNIGTSRNIDAVYSYWGSDKSFKELFLQTAEDKGLDLDSLDKNCCYSYILQHSEVCIGYDSVYDGIWPLNKINLDTLEETLYVPTYRDNPQIEDLRNQMSYNTNFMLITETGKRIKMLSKEYKHAKALLNNNPSVKWTCLEILKDQKSHEFIKYFPSKSPILDEVNSKLRYTIEELHRLYFDRFIKKIRVDMPYKYRKIIYNLHGNFKFNKIKTTKQVIANYLIELDTKTLYWLLDLASV